MLRNGKLVVRLLNLRKAVRRSSCMGFLKAMEDDLSGLMSICA